tara:strand:+ start:12014 stop:12589 length:576 start_codon:yes stop_codon:yes gene_type:complete
MNNILNSFDTYNQNYDTINITDYTQDNINYNINNNGVIPDILDKSNYNSVSNSSIIYNSTQIDSIKGNYEQTLLTHNFFSDNNIKSIQDSIRFYVYKQTTTVIDYQNETDLINIMRSQLLQYGDLSLSNKESVLNEIHRINKMVINYCISDISSEISMYNFYINDLNKLKTPIPLPIYINKNNKEEGHPYV